jgi:hypothetical protein
MTEDDEREDGSGQIVRTIRLTDATQLMLGISEFHGKPYASFSKFIVTESFTGPKSGFGVSREVLPSLLGRMVEISGQLEEILRGQLPLEFCRIRKNARSEVIMTVAADEKKPGVTYVDIRTFVTSPKFTGWTRKGIRIPVDGLDALIDGTRALSVAINAWVPPMPPLFRGTQTETRDPSARNEASSADRGIPSKYSDYFG